MRSYKPDELFDANGTLVAELADLPPKGRRRMGMNPHANGGLLLEPLRLPAFRNFAVEVKEPGSPDTEATRVLGQVFTRSDEVQSGVAQFPSVRARRDGVKPAGGAVRGHREDLGGFDTSGGRTFGDRWAGDGDFERAHVPGLAGRLSADRAARFFFVLRGVHSHY